MIQTEISAIKATKYSQDKTQQQLYLWHNVAPLNMHKTSPDNTVTRGEHINIYEVYYEFFHL